MRTHTLTRPARAASQPAYSGRWCACPGRRRSLHDARYSLLQCIEAERILEEENSNTRTGVATHWSQNQDQQLVENLSGNCTQRNIMSSSSYIAYMHVYTHRPTYIHKQTYSYFDPTSISQVFHLYLIVANRTQCSTRLWLYSGPISVKFIF